MRVQLDALVVVVCAVDRAVGWCKEKGRCLLGRKVGAGGGSEKKVERERRRQAIPSKRRRVVWQRFWPVPECLEGAWRGPTEGERALEARGGARAGTYRPGRFAHPDARAPDGTRTQPASQPFTIESWTEASRRVKCTCNGVYCARCTFTLTRLNCLRQSLP